MCGRSCISIKYVLTIIKKIAMLFINWPTWAHQQRSYNRIETNFENSSGVLSAPACITIDVNREMKINLILRHMTRNTREMKCSGQKRKQI